MFNMLFLCSQCSFYAPNKANGCSAYKDTSECPMRLVNGVLKGGATGSSYYVILTTENKENLPDILTLLDGLADSLMENNDD